MQLSILQREYELTPINMKHLYILILLVTFTNVAHSQKKKASAAPQPLSISNIKLGMTYDDFVTKYPDSISRFTVSNSTRNVFYDNLKINNVEVYDVICVFFKEKLAGFYFKTNSIAIHLGLDAKYGYKRNDEFEKDLNGEWVTIGYYVITDNNLLLRIKYQDESEQIMMEDRKAIKLSSAEGF